MGPDILSCRHVAGGGEPRPGTITPAGEAGSLGPPTRAAASATILCDMESLTNDPGSRAPARAVVVTGLVAAVAAGGLALATGRTEHTARDTHRFEAPKDLAVRVDGGDVRVAAGDAVGVLVTRDARWSGPHAPSAPSMEHGILRMGGCGPWWNRVLVLPQTCRATYTATVPAGTRVDLTSDTGSVDVAGRYDALAVRSDTGGVDVSRAEAPEASVRVDTGGIRLGPGVARIGARTDTGRIRGEGLTASRVNAGTDTGGIDLGFASPPDSVELRTDTGGITLRLPRGGYAIDARTDTGGVDIDPVLQNGSSARRIVLRTDTGGITVEVAP